MLLSLELKDVGAVESCAFEVYLERTIRAELIEYLFQNFYL